MLSKRKKTRRRKKPKGVSRKKFFLRKFGRFFKVSAIFLSSLGFVLAFYQIVIGSDYFRISKVEIYGTHTFVNKNDLQSLIERKAVGRHISRLDTKQLEVIAQDSFQGSKSVEIKKRFPNKVIVNVNERIPMALLINFDEKEYFIVDEDGYILGIVDDEKTDLPEILYDGELKVGYFIDKDLIPLYLDLLSTLNSENLEASSVSVSGRFISFYSDSVQILIGKEKNVIESVKIISELLKQLGLEGKEVSKIDLRYDKVIVEY